MPVPYSLDLRERVLSALDSGMNKMTAHKTFQVSRSTIDHWQKRRAATGSAAPETGLRRGVLPAITDLEQFEAFAQRHSNATLAQMAQAWQEETGCRLSNVTIGKTLRRLGWTRKKELSLPRTCEQERHHFLKVLKNIPQQQRVYVYEAGVDDTISYAYGWSQKGARCPGERLGHLTKRVSMAAAWCQSAEGQTQVISPLTFEGYCNAALVEAWFNIWRLHCKRGR